MNLWRKLAESEVIEVKNNRLMLVKDLPLQQSKCCGCSARRPINKWKDLLEECPAKDLDELERTRLDTVEVIASEALS